MSRCFSLVNLLDGCFGSIFSKSGLRPTTTDFGDGTVMHCWVPKRRKESKPDLVLIHGFGVNTTWQWVGSICHLTADFNVYVPDLVFFGESRTTRPERTVGFQAECVMRVLEANEVRKVRAVVGLSYGGYVAYSMAARYGGEKVERVVICCSAVCVEEKDLTEGKFVVPDVEAAVDVLTPQTPEKLMELLGYAIYRPPKYLPACFLNDFIQVMCTDYVEQRRDLVRTIIQDRKISEIPKINQVSNLPFEFISSNLLSKLSQTFKFVVFSIAADINIVGRQRQSISCRACSQIEKVWSH
ncbi:hypothetical protein Dimus_024931 [Dionaea muscipula]